MRKKQNINPFHFFLLLVLFVTLLSRTSVAKTTFINPTWLKTVISIETFPPGSKSPQPIGTGFLISTPNGNYALVTAKHVIINKKTGKTRANLAYRMNRKKKPSVLMLDLHLSKTKGDWLHSKTSDLSLRFFNLFSDSDIRVIPLEASLGLEEILPGAPALILGFPMGLRDANYTKPIVRRAMVAGKDSATILVDGFVFPGNSGGPVVYSPTLAIFNDGNADKYTTRQMLIGIVRSYVPYRDICISQQTNKPRIIFEENSGLFNVIPTDEILKIMDSYDFKKLDTSHPD